MSLRNRRIALAGGIAALTFAAGVQAQQSGAAPAPVDAQVLKNAGTSADALPGSWLSYGRSQSETRYSPLKQIDAANVSGWDSRGRTRSAPAAATRKARR